MDLKAFYRLSEYYPKEISFLIKEDPFRFLICVILSAQTTDKKVNEVSPILFGKYPDADSLSKADQKTVEEIIRPLGFYSMKAKNIIATASLIKDGIPETMEELIKLPGVGRKTASCYLGDILGHPAIIVDTHFFRVARRLGYTDANTAEGVELDLKKKVDPTLWYRMSMVLNKHGREFCYAKKPDCPGCPVKDICPSALV